MRIPKEQRVVHPPTVMKASRRFGMYKKENEKKVRNVDIVKDEVIENIKKIWIEAGDKSCFAIYLAWEGYYRSVIYALDFPKSRDYSPKDVEKFCLLLSEFQNERDFTAKAGLFLSALINNRNSTEYVLHTSHFPEPLCCIGYRNKKRIMVNGDVGDFVGNYMEGGMIVVEGNADKWAGSDMKDGIIKIKGRARECVGRLMQGGEIRVDGGEYVSPDEDIFKGRIYHKGKLIVDK